MELDVTPILLEDCALLSASQAELGPMAGEITWRNCLALAKRLPLATDANRDDIRDYFREYGAWSDEEIEAWTDTELSAMVWQEAAASMREFEVGTAGNRPLLLFFANGEPSAAYLYLGV